MSRRLLIVTQHFWPENFRINDIAEGFVRDGIAVDVLCGLPNYPQGEWFDGYGKKGPFYEERDGIRIFRAMEIPRTGNTSLRIFLNYVSWPLYAAAAVKRLPGDYDAVLCYNTSPVLMSWPAILAAKRFKAPMTNYVLDVWPENLYSVVPVKNALLRKIALAVSDWHYRRADRLIAMSDGLYERLNRRVGEKNRGFARREEKRYTVIPQYCEDFYAVPAQPEQKLAESGKGKFTLLFAGNFSPAQSLETAIQAAALLKTDPQVPAIRLVLVGSGMSGEALTEMVSRLQLEDTVQFTGRVDAKQIPAFTAAADALLVSLSDSPDLGLTIPAKLASCQAAKKPLLVSLNGEGARAAQQSGGALVSPAGDAARLAANWKALAAMSEADRREMGEAGFAWYQNHYRRDVLLDRLEKFIF